MVLGSVICYCLSLDCSMFSFLYLFVPHFSGMEVFIFGFDLAEFQHSHKMLFKSFVNWYDEGL